MPGELIDCWIKSSFSNGNGGNNCIEVRRSPMSTNVLVRDSRHPDTWMAFSREDFAAFLAGAKTGEFDDLVS
jgi:hypothetical protein